MEDKQRLIYIDLLRICAAFSVIVLHVSASQFRNVETNSFAWEVFNFYDSMVRWCVPIFLMISGSFFLNPNKNFSIKEIYTKYILRLIMALICWGMFYEIFLGVINNEVVSLQYIQQGFKNILSGNARYHLWYVYALIGLYIVTPILRLIVRNAKKIEIEYFLIIFLIVTVLIPRIVMYEHFSWIKSLIKQLNINMVLGYVGFYIAGYYISNFKVDKKKASIIYILGVGGAITTVVGTSYLSGAKGMLNTTFYETLSPNVVFMSLAIFLYFRQVISKVRFSAKVQHIIVVIANYSFGIYLTHDIFKYIFEQVGFITTAFNPIVSVIFISGIIFILSLGVSFLARKIPYIGKFIS